MKSTNPLVIFSFSKNFYLNSKLYLNIHINKVFRRVFQLLGFVMRSTLDFKETTSFMFIQSPRSQLEYAVSAWTPLCRMST